VKCIESWKKHCPDYQIIEWNEENFDVNQNEYTSFCYQNKLWAYLSDYARLKVVYDNGGIYFDTDVEVIKSFNPLLNHSAFFGFENDKFIASGLGFGAKKEHYAIKLMLDEYYTLNCDKKGKPIPIGCPILNTKTIEKLGFKLNGKTQNIADLQLLSSDFLNPYNDSIGKLRKTKNTYSIHWFAKSALSKKQKIRATFTRPFHRIFGVDCFKPFKKFLRR
jgi:mannosyltransferase OCH1-like enzyme